MAIEYNFKYMPLVGKLSGESMVKQTETAINEIAKIVNDNSAQAEIINTLAEQANANSVEALEKATEALDTSSRVYIKETLAVNLNNYCESQLIYINNVYSQNMPVAHKGFLEVKTNDDKTQATQVFADDVDRKFYVRTGAITATTVGDITTYTASYGAWVDIPNITDLDNYLALAGGTMSGDIQFSASEWKIKGSDIDNDAELSIVGATDNLNGSSLNLYGRNHTESGAFELNANNGTYTKTLKGTATGNLTWDGNVTADNFIGDGATITGTASVDGQINVDGVVSVENGSNTAVNTLQRSTAYAVDDIVYTSEINAKYYLLCTTAGTTASTLPSFANVESNMQITDGTVVWKVQTVTSQEKVDSKIAEEITRTDGKFLPTAGGTMTGSIQYVNNGKVFAIGNTITGNVDLGWSWDNREGAGIGLRSTDYSNPGEFTLFARDSANSCSLLGKPNGDLTWNGKKLNHTVDLSVFKTAQQFTAPSIITSRVKDLGGGYKKVGNIVYVYVRFRMNTTLTKGGWGVLNGFPAPYNMGFSADYRIPLIATAWYGDPYSGNVSSAFIDSDGTMRLITNGQIESTNTTNYYIHVYGTYYAE